MKTAELTGWALDYWVARAQGFTMEHANIGTGWVVVIPGQGAKVVGMGAEKPMAYAPSVNWAQGGPIIERERVYLFQHWKAPEDWVAWIGASWAGGYELYGHDFEGTGPTPLAAAMRAFVASRLGDELPDVSP